MAEDSNSLDPGGSNDEDGFGVVFSTELRGGEAQRIEIDRIPDDATRPVTDAPEPDPSPKSPVERSKVHPLLRKWLGERSGSEREQVIIVLSDPIVIPRFPDPATDESRTSERNRQSAREADELITRIEAQRAPGYEEFEAVLRQFGGEVLGRYWLINGVVAEVPLASVEELAAQPNVVSIEPRFSGEQPPQAEVDDGRALINSDPYVVRWRGDAWIGLLDTGVRHSHKLLDAPSRIGFRRDCVNGGLDCNTGPLLDPDDHHDHGTASAAIVVGNDNRGDRYRGVTGMILDSFRVYDPVGLDPDAAVRGFQEAVRVLDRVILAEIQGDGDHLSGLADAANRAFDAGAVVIAANGNMGSTAGTVKCPANAHKVIGVGAFDAETGVQYKLQSCGPTDDGRIKPDIQAPTNTRTAGSADDDDLTMYGATSGAAPYAAGAAALLRDRLRGTSFSIDPGHVYAQLILCGQRPYPFDNIAGAGPLQLPPDGHASWGKVLVADQTIVEISVTIHRPVDALDAALWWPDVVRPASSSTVDPHSRIYLQLLDPAGAIGAASTSSESVFQRCRAAGPLAPGAWRVRVTGLNVPFEPQPVYWATHASDA